MRSVWYCASVLLLCGTTVLLVSAQTRQCVCAQTRDDDPLNIREGPGTAYDVVGTTLANKCFYYEGQSGSSWYQVQYAWHGGQSAYISASYASSPHACATRENGRCADAFCSSFNQFNDPRLCDPQGCGYYGASRGTREHNGSDVKCTMGDIVNAPFRGIYVREVKPYGDGSCCDTGFEMNIKPDPAFLEDETISTATLRVFYSRPTVTVGTELERGQQVATHAGLHCGCYSTTMTDHAHFEIRLNGVLVDSTSYAYCDIYP